MKARLTIYLHLFLTSTRLSHGSRAEGHVCTAIETLVQQVPMLSQAEAWCLYQVMLPWIGRWLTYRGRNSNGHEDPKDWKQMQRLEWYPLLYYQVLTLSLCIAKLWVKMSTQQGLPECTFSCSLQIIVVTQLLSRLNPHGIRAHAKFIQIPKSLTYSPYWCLGLVEPILILPVCWKTLTKVHGDVMLTWLSYWFPCAQGHWNQICGAPLHIAQASMTWCTTSMLWGLLNLGGYSESSDICTCRPFCLYFIVHVDICCMCDSL